MAPPAISLTQVKAFGAAARTQQASHRRLSVFCCDRSGMDMSPIRGWETKRRWLFHIWLLLQMLVAAGEELTATTVSQHQKKSLEWI